MRSDSLAGPLRVIPNRGTQQATSLRTVPRVSYKPRLCRSRSRRAARGATCALPPPSPLPVRWPDEDKTWHATGSARSP